MRRIRFRKRGRKKLLLLLPIIIVVMIVVWPYFCINIKLYGNKKFLLDYGEEYSEPGYKVTFLGKNVTRKAITSSNIAKENGDYYIKYKYKYKYSLVPIVKTREVIRNDMSGPNIELVDGDNLEVTINTEYKEPGYKATDNYDGDVTDKVMVSGNVDVNKLGDYVLTYTVTDDSGNTTKKNRNVKVERVRPTQMSLTKYTLDGWYDDDKLKTTENKGEKYFNTIKIIGDSHVMLMHQSKLISNGNAWGVPCLHAESMFTKKVNNYGMGEEILLLDAISKYKPQRIILSFGTFSTSWITKEVFIKNANDMITKIKELSPNTQIALISIYPIDISVEWSGKFKQAKINEYNFYILEMAHNHKVKFLDVSSILKGDDGYVKKSYSDDDGYHLSYLGYKKVKEYIMTHAFEEE